MTAWLLQPEQQPSRIAIRVEHVPAVHDRLSEHDTFIPIAGDNVLIASLEIVV